MASSKHSKYWTEEHLKFTEKVHPVWLWGHSLFKISSAGPVFYGNKWLLWHPHRQGPTLHLRCRNNKGLIKRGSTIDLQRSWCKGWFLWPAPYTYIPTYWKGGGKTHEKSGRYLVKYKIFPVNYFIRSLLVPRRWVPVYQYLEFRNVRLWFKYNRFCPFEVNYSKTRTDWDCFIE
jgi:hypothetical protein